MRSTEAPPAANVSVPWIVVDDARLALAWLSAEFFAHPSRAMKVVGITGTNGKTTTSFLTSAILDAAGVQSGLMGTVTYRVGDRAFDATRTTPEAPDLQSFMRGMAQQQPVFQGSKTLMMQLLCAGEVALAFPVNFNQANDAKKRGCPSDWVVIEPQTQRPPFVIAMAQNAPHPAAAKLFIDFLLAKEPQRFMQENIFRQSPRLDVEPSGDLAKLKGVRVWKSDWNAIFKERAAYTDAFKKVFKIS